MKKLITKNNYVRNKDRQDPTAVLKLSDDKLIEHLSSVGCVVHTIIPETTKFTENNKVGMYINKSFRYLPWPVWIHFHADV